MRTTLTLTPYALPAAVSLLFKAAIYFYARFSKIHNRQTRIYLLFLFGLSIQNIAEIIIFSDKGARLPSSWGGKLYLSASIFAIALLLHLALVVATKWRDKKIPILGLLLLYLPPFILQGLLWGTSLFVIGFEPMGYTYTRIPGPLYFTWEVYSLGYFCIAMALLAYGLKTQRTPFQRLQNKLLLIGLSPVVVVAISIIILQHFGFRGFNATGTLPFAVTFFLVVTAYAIHQHRLFDIEFFIPWSKLRKRKTRFYERIQAVIAEIAQMRSGQKALQALSDLFRCQVALIGGEQTAVAMPLRVVPRNAAPGGFDAGKFPREALNCVDRIVVANEIVERDPALYRIMGHHGVGAIVPFNLPRAIGHQWLVLGNQFSEQVYTPLDFQRVEALFARIADCFLDDFLSLRSSFAAALQRNDAQWRRQVQQKERELMKSEQVVATLEEENSLLRRELALRQPVPLIVGKGNRRRMDEPVRDGYVYAPGHSRICGTGIYLPEERVTTQELLREIDSKNRFGVPYHWIERVIGIKEKRVTPPGILPSDMAVAAAREAMERAKILPRQIDAIIYVGLTRDYLEPATAHVVQAKLGAMNATVFDVSNACHGFMNGIHIVDALIAAGQIRSGLIVAGEQGSLFVREALEALKGTTDHDRFTTLAVNLTGGDAGAAMVLGPKEAPDGGLCGLLLQSQGQYASLCAGGGSIGGGPLLTDMPALVGEAAKLIKGMFEEFMYERLKWQIPELTKCLVHQIGTRGLFTVHRDLLGIPEEIMPKTVDVFGNLITVNIPLTLHNCVIGKEIKAGQKIYISGSGSGLSISQAGLIWDTA